LDRAMVPLSVSYNSLLTFHYLYFLTDIHYFRLHDPCNSLC